MFLYKKWCTIVVRTIDTPFIYSIYKEWGFLIYLAYATERVSRITVILT